MSAQGRAHTLSKADELLGEFVSWGLDNFLKKKIDSEPAHIKPGRGHANRKFKRVCPLRDRSDLLKSMVIKE